jgi:hypothetical protein
MTLSILRSRPNIFVYSHLSLIFAALLTHMVVGQEPDQPVAGREIRVSTREALQQSLVNARPGDRILVAPGEYSGGLTARNLRGERQRPIVIAAADSQAPPIFAGGGAAFHLSSPVYVELRDLVIKGASGNGLNIDDGGSTDSPARGIILSGLRISDTGPRGNRDGIKLSGVNQFSVIDCVIDRWGDGGSGIDMVGCHQGRIERCRFQDRGDSGGNGVQMKGGSSQITVSGCRFENAGGRALNLGGSTGAAYFRPATANVEATRITVEDNTIIGSMAAIAFVGVDQATVRYNTVYEPTHWLFRILQENRDERFLPCRQGVVEHNLIVFRANKLRAAVNVGPGVDAQSFRFAANYWYCVDTPERSRRTDLPTPEMNGRHGVDPQFTDPEKLDLSLKPSSPVQDAGVRTKPTHLRGQP